MTQSPTRSQTFFNEDGVAGLTQRAVTAAAWRITLALGYSVRLI